MLYSKVRTRRVSTGNPPPERRRQTPPGDRRRFGSRRTALQSSSARSLPPARRTRWARIRSVAGSSNRTTGCMAPPPTPMRRQTAPLLDDVGKTRRGHFAVGERQQQPDDVALHGAAHLLGLGCRGGSDAAIVLHPALAAAEHRERPGPTPSSRRRERSPGTRCTTSCRTSPEPPVPPTIVVVAVALTVRIDRSLSRPPLALTARAITSRTDAADAGPELWTARAATGARGTAETST